MASRNPIIRRAEKQYRTNTTVLALRRSTLCQVRRRKASPLGLPRLRHGSAAAPPGSAASSTRCTPLRHAREPADDR